MTEHVVLKTAKRDLKYYDDSSVKAGMPRLLVDAANLKWLVEQAERAIVYEAALHEIKETAQDEEIHAIAYVALNDDFE